MKLTHTQNMKASKSGMTLLELTVVILVLLSLISILFIGARAWKKGSDRAAPILQIRNCQQAVRSFANMNGLNPLDNTLAIGSKLGSSFTTLEAEVFGSGKFIENNPVNGTHPAGSSVNYTYGTSLGVAIPDIGELFVICDDGDYMPSQNSYTDW
jgi:type II secretory pathway pseudopilin PulG